MGNVRQILGRCLAALVACAVSAPAGAAELSVEDLNVSYIQQTTTDAKGFVSFNLRFQALGGDPGNYDLFSAQVMISKLLAGAPATFTLDEFETENTAPLAPDYWIDSVPTGHQNASIQQLGTQFRFSDFVPIPQAITPNAGDIVAHYMFHFNVASPGGFGEYQIAAGLQQFNRFTADLVNFFPNTITPGIFILEPIPEPSTLAVVLIGTPLLRRRRRAR
jgi:hypothetical protein